ncbi:MAG TPA: DUF3795 domain-containing protein [Anaerolineae bacterium]|nr:DUF3795 domain-containing protein [Anaerolineae bacterium]
METSEAKTLVGCCGLYCGLCNKYQSKAPSRCIGCQLGEQHSWCSIWNCCVKKHGFKTCTECEEIFNCPIFLKRKVAEWVPAAGNLRQMKALGLESWLGEQVERQALLEELLQNYNEGRSMSFYCKACARLSPDLINQAIEAAKECLAGEKTAESDVKLRARVLRTVMERLALEADIDLQKA